MKRLEDWAAVHQVYQSTRSKRKTAEILGISRNTVRRLLGMTEQPVYKRSVYPSRIDAYKEQIIEWRCAPYEFNGTRIFRELKTRGYTGSIGPVYRYLRQVDEDRDLHISSKATCRCETPLGDQAQFDWTEYEVPVDGRIRKVYCFSMILAASRKKAVCFSLREDADAIYEAIQELFGDLGGVTLELLIDNPKALVIENRPRSEDEIRYNPHALMLAKHLGTELNACPCFWPRKKGKIEKPFQYIDEQFIKGNSFASMEDLNRRGKAFIDDWCNEVHSTTGRIPNQHYLLEEKPMLQPLPEGRYRVGELQQRIVSNDSYVSIQANKYSVPVKYVGRKVMFRIVYGFRIEIYDRKGRLILTEEALDGKGLVLARDEHYDPVRAKVPTSIPQIRRDFTARFSNGLRYLEAAAKQFDQPTHHARRIMELQDLYPDELLDALIGIAVDRGQMDTRSFRQLIRSYNSGVLRLDEPSAGSGPGKAETGSAAAVPGYRDDDPALVRDCSYYDRNVSEVGRNG